jgi:hypothetical protein
MLRFAIVDDMKQLPFREGRGFCPTCGGPVIAKCGSIKIHHWAHETRDECDTWSEPIGPWHLSWQDLARPEFVEVTMGPHRADLIGDGGVVVELQHSAIASDEIIERESFYNSMVWVFDAADRFGMVVSGNRAFFSFGRTKHVLRCEKPMFLDFRGEIVEVESLSKILPGFSGFGRRRDRRWFVSQYLSNSIKEGAEISDSPDDDRRVFDRWAGKRPYEFTDHPTRWMDPSTGNSYLLPKSTPYILLDYGWRNRATGDRTSAGSRIITTHPTIADGWTEPDFKRMQDFLQAKAGIFNGRLSLLPASADTIRTAMTVSSAEHLLKQADEHIKAGLIPILKDQTKQRIIERARQYEISQFGKVLRNEKRIPRSETDKKWW